MISASVLTVGMPCRQYSESLVPDVARREKIPLVMRSTTAVPLPIRECERVVDRTTDVA
jgi:hypothetical protein